MKWYFCSLDGRVFFNMYKYNFLFSFICSVLCLNRAQGRCIFPLFYYDTSSSPKEMQSCSAYSVVVARVINPAIRAKSSFKKMLAATHGLSLNKYKEFHIFFIHNWTCWALSKYMYSPFFFFLFRVIFASFSSSNSYRSMRRPLLLRRRIRGWSFFSLLLSPRGVPELHTRHHRFAIVCRGRLTPI